jgi:type I restriction enzyme S subunit
MQIDDLLLYETEIPSLRIQHEAVNILNLLDSKIALNNQMNETLESIAKAIFKEWFIDFGPVRAKSEGRRPFGMDDETAALFPDSFEDSELGPIPKGWKVELVENIFKLTIGRTPPRKESQWFSNSDNNIKWVSIKDMGNSSVYLSNTSEFLTQQAIEKFKIPIVHSNVVILSFKLTLGRISITTEPMVTNEAIAHFTPKENSFLKLPFYTYCYLSSFNYEKLGSTSSIATAINSTLLKSIKFLIPNVHILIRFNKLVESTFKQIKNNQLENNNLIKIQNLLLPKLISGEISLSNNDISTISNETTTHIPPIQQKIYAYTKNEGKINM